MKKSYYCVKIGKKPGIYTTWNECLDNVNKFLGCTYKKFHTIDEANKYMNNKAASDNSLEKYLIINQDINKTIDTKQRIIEDNELDKYNDDIHIFTDGASIKTKDITITSLAIYFCDNDTRNIAKIIQGTNNRAELQAVVESINIIKDKLDSNKNIIIHTDSQYVIQCLTATGKKYVQNKMVNKHNYDLIEQGLILLNKYNNIKLHHVKAHTDNKDFYSICNKKVDIMANKILITDTKFVDIKFDFGKYKNKTFKEIYKNDKEYFEWCSKLPYYYAVKLYYDIMNM